MVSMDPFLVKLGMVYYKQSVLSVRHSQNAGCVASWVPGNRSGASGPIGPIYPVLSCLGFQKVIEYHSQSKLLVSTHQSPPVYSGVLLQQVEYSPQLLTEMHGGGDVIVGLYGGVLKWGYPQLIQNSCNLPFSDTYPYIWKLGTTYLRYGCVWQILKMWKWQIFRHTHISSYLYVFSTKYLKFALGFSGLSDLAGECAASHTVTGLGWRSWEEPLRYGAQLPWAYPNSWMV